MTSWRAGSLLAGAGVVIALAAALGVEVGAAAAGSGHSVRPSQSAADRYGGLPSFLPRSTLHPDATLDGSSARPALTSEGDSIQARLPHGSVLITVWGPEVPGEGLPFQARADTATWVVTMSHAEGSVPIATAAFSTIDMLGKIYQPALVPGQPRPPAAIKPGQTIRFELRVVMRVGEGMMRWAPVGHDLVGSWDFVVEND